MVERANKSKRENGWEREREGEREILNVHPSIVYSIKMPMKLVFVFRYDICVFSHSILFAKESLFKCNNKLVYKNVLDFLDFCFSRLVILGISRR